MEITPMGIAKNKVWIIYILDVLNMRLKEDQLAEICDRFKLMGCFDFSLAINELRNTNLVKFEESPLGMLYSMSELGKDCLDCFAKELSYTKRKEVAAELKKDADDIYLHSVICHDSMRLKDGRYRIMLRMIENDLEVFDITLIARNQAENDKIIEQWNNNALKVYDSVFLALGRE